MKKLLQIFILIVASVSLQFSFAAPVAPPGNTIRVVATGGLLAGQTLFGVIVDPVTANVFVAGVSGFTGNNFNLYKITPAGVVTFIANYPFGYFQAVKMAWGPDGKIYTHNSNTNTVYSIDPTTGTSSLFSSGIVLGSPRHSLNFDAAGRLIIGYESMFDFIWVTAGGPVYLGNVTAPVPNGNHGDGFGILPNGDYVVYTDCGGQNNYAISTAGHVNGTPYPSLSWTGTTDIFSIMTGCQYSLGTVDPLNGDVYTTINNGGSGNDKIILTGGSGGASTVFISGGSGITDIYSGKASSGSGISLYFVDRITNTVYEVVKECSSTAATFNFTNGLQTWVVPSGVTSVDVEVWGAEGANALDRLTTNATGGLGGYSKGKLAVTPGQVLNIYVGGVGNTNGSGGFNGGGKGGNSNAGSSCFGGPAGGGGGASDIRLGGTALTDRVIVGAGGGGSGRDYCNGSCQPCGCGGGGGGAGGLNGTNGAVAYDCGFSYNGSGVNNGKGASGAAGGVGGTGDGGGNSGAMGALGIGGIGANGDYDVAGGGGGGGYYGGGGGGGASSGSGVAGGGAGGGSSYLGGVTSGTTTSGVRLGNGLVIISFPGNATISCPSNITMAKTPGSCTKIVTYTSSSSGNPTPTITYAFSGATTGSGSGNGSGSAFSVGTTTVNLKANNGCSEATCSFTVTITGCLYPIQVYHRDTTTNAAKIKWKAQSGACATGGLYELRNRYELSPGVWSPWTAWVFKTGPALEHNFTGLGAGRFYHYQIRTICGNTNSTEINGWFHTLPLPLRKDNPDLIAENGRFESLQPDLEDFEKFPLKLILAPNPANDFTELYIQGFEKSNKEVAMYDLNGRLVFRVRVTADQNNLGLDLKTLKVHNGVYLIRVSDGKNQKTEQLIIER
ncbi:MAG: T9SS type A sorting domain-containing protein [Saprospiraceae bacterium]|nr:T9SS type A sorting domain-containing protein [Saprospiraceae bacterium]